MYTMQFIHMIFLFYISLACT